MSTFSFVIVMVALLIQMLWLYITRRSQNKYLGDLVVFKKPTGQLSKYYQWRVESIRNSILDGIIFEVSILVTISIMTILFLDLAQVYLIIPVVVFVLAISGLTVAQNVYRINQTKKIEQTLVTRLEASYDKIETARSLVMPLIGSERKEDGRVWFSLYKIAQRQDKIGWSVRDVLLDKSLKERADSLEPGSPSKDYGSRNPDTGPGIN